ncbi:hypothetical protein SAMN05421548_117106 [Paraburkholderia lycopersici]|uniref:Uncharacterized protein n=1 Tax=Paraburkholderia lycopersici TaxID=416944 RepID=A0A1G6TQR7_9BURK|nr:hypothetical protein SAMN05421548_117106 [Paraburkholderia lycopersici]
MSTRPRTAATTDSRADDAIVRVRPRMYGHGLMSLRVWPISGYAI